MNAVEALVTTKEKFVKYKNLLRNGAIGNAPGAFPALPTLSAAPATVPAGIFPLIGNMVGRIKNHPNYTEAIGRDLGIIGAEQTSDRK